MFLMKTTTTNEGNFVTVGDVQGVRSDAIERWTRQTLKIREVDYLTGQVVVHYDDDLITMTATVVLWSI